MTKTFFKLFFVWDYEKEEQWLNEMSKKGWQLVSPGLGFYKFKKDTPNKYNYALEFVSDNSNDYIDFLEETGIEVIGKYFNWNYYRKLNDGKPFEIYNDQESKISHLERIKRFLSLFLVIEGFFLFYNIIDMFTSDFDKYDLYSTFIFLIIVLLFTYGIYRIDTIIKKIKKIN